MRSSAVFLLASAGLAIAHPSHGHQHVHKARQAPGGTTVVVAGPTIVSYELNGQVIPDSEVQAGLANGSLVIVNGAPVPSASAQPVSISAQAPSAPASVPASSAAASSAAPAPVSSAPVVAQKNVVNHGPPAVAHSSAAAPPASSAPQSSGSGSYGTSGTGVDSVFPDGTIDCTDFPSAYGALSVSYMGLGGWIGIQKPGSSSGGYGDIETITSSQCDGSSGLCCTEGSFCSYACPAGYQKSQWPSTQGSSGQSVGGLICTNGKLHLTQPSISQLCTSGASEVDISIVNNLGASVAVCRTDYPGTEAETVPLGLAAGSSSPLTCPNSENYYTWKGGQTSAQYYVNPSGSEPSTACQWGDAGTNIGNYAPLNLGVGYSGGKAWLAIFQNAPTTNAKLDFKVSIVGDISGECVYENGLYNGGSSGCTVS